MRRSREPKRPADRLTRRFGVMTVLGAVLTLAGVVGLVYVGVATVTTVLLFGWLLLIGGVVGLVSAIQYRKTTYVWPALVIAALNLAAGIVAIKAPTTTAAGLTLFAALLFLAGGIFRLGGGVAVRGPQLGWTLLQGLLDLLLGILVLANWPHSRLYVLGSFFSLFLIFDGLGLIATGLLGRRIVEAVVE